MWNEGQIKKFVRDLKANWAPHWHLIVPELRAAIVDAQVLALVVGLDRETVPVAQIDALRKAMHEGMGTLGS